VNVGSFWKAEYEYHGYVEFSDEDEAGQAIIRERLIAKSWSREDLWAELRGMGWSNVTAGERRFDQQKGSVVKKDALGRDIELVFKRRVKQKQ
jgi:hypothetical protein